MASKEVAPLIAKEFIALKLDFDRATGAKEIELRFIDKEQGLPWFAFVDAGGKCLINSTGSKGNIGHPAQPHEVAYFKTMLQTVKKHLTDADIDFLIQSIEAFNKSYGK